MLEKRKADLSVCRSVCQGVRVCVWEMFACLPWQELLRFFICLLRNSFFARSFASTRVSPVRIVWLSPRPHTATPRPGNQRAMWHSFALSENEGHGCVGICVYVGIGVSVCVCRWFPTQRQAQRGEAKHAANPQGKTTRT